MRVVLDTNILVAALITARTPPDQIYSAWRKQRRFVLITSDWQLEELSRVTHSIKLERYIKHREAGNLVNGLRRRAEVLERLPAVDFSSDPNDNPVVAMAMEGRADFLPLLPRWSVGARGIRTGRRLKLSFGWGCPALPAFRRVYAQLAGT